MYRFKHRDVLLERLKNHGHRETEPLSSCIQSAAT